MKSFFEFMTLDRKRLTQNCSPPAATAWLSDIGQTAPWCRRHVSERIVVSRLPSFAASAHTLHWLSHMQTRETT